MNFFGAASGENYTTRWRNSVGPECLAGDYDTERTNHGDMCCGSPLYKPCTMGKASRMKLSTDGLIGQDEPPKWKYLSTQS